MANLVSVRLQRSDGSPWGFRLQGGVDFSAPLVIQRINGGSISDNAGLRTGDAIVKINNTEVYNLKHKECQDVIIKAGNSFEITVARGGATWKPSVTPVPGQLPSPNPSSAGTISPVTKTSLAATPQPTSAIGSGHNTPAKPFAAVNGKDGQVRSIVNKQYNTPVGMYSEETIAETLSSQAEVLAGGVLGVNFKKNERIYNAANSEVYKMLHEGEASDPEPARNSPVASYHSPPQHQHQQHAPQNNIVTKHVMAPVAKTTAPSGGLPVGQNICEACDRLIVGVFVRIKDKNLHVECFKCATCGTSLKNQGYFNVNSRLYCDIHARLAALSSPPPGTNGMVPVAIKPGPKSGVQAISAALSQHANLNGAYKNDNLPHTMAAKPFNKEPAQVAFPPPPPASQSWQDKPAAAPAPAPAPAPVYAPPPVAAPAPVQAPAPVPVNIPQPAAPKPAAPAPNTQENGFKAGHATRLLDDSVNKLNLKNMNNDFKTQASNVLKEMLETRLKKQNGSALIIGTEGIGKKVLKSEHPMSRIIDLCDAKTNIPPPPPLIPSKINGFSDEVVMRKKQDGRPFNNRKVSQELTSHARDRRSYVERNNNNNSNNLNNNKVEGLDPVSIAEQLDNGTHPVCKRGNHEILKGPFITALGRTWCPEHFVCTSQSCKRPLADIGFVEEKGDLYCEYCFEEFLAPACSKCNQRIKGDCLNAIGRQFHPECFKCTFCGKLFGNNPFFLEEGDPYCEADWNELFTTKCFACGFPVEAGDRWVEALNNNYHSQCFNCTMCKKNLEGQSFFAKGGRPFCKNHAR